MIRRLLLLPVLFLLVCLAFPVWAQDGGVVFPPLDGSAGDPLGGTIASTLAAFSAGNIILGVIGVLLVLSQLVQLLGGRLPDPVGAVFRSEIATWLIPQVMSVLGYLATTFSVQPFSWPVFLGAIAAALGAGGVRWAQQQAAKAAAERAAAGVTDKSAAVDVLRRGPQP